jgi:hypothetical protein
MFCVVQRGLAVARHAVDSHVSGIQTGGEYYWMAGNFMKYGASDSASGRVRQKDARVREQFRSAAES